MIFEDGSIVDYHMPDGTVEKAVVLEKLSETTAVLRTLCRHPANDRSMGPSNQGPADSTPVTIDSTGTVGTANVAAATVIGLVARDIRDAPEKWVVTPKNFDDTFWVVVNGPHRHWISVGQPSRPTWVTHQSKTEYTHVDVDVRHGAGTSVTVQLYVGDGDGVTGPDAVFAEQVDGSMEMLSDDADSDWQTMSILVPGALHPGSVSGTMYSLRIVSGTPGGFTWEMRNPRGYAQG